MQKFASYSQKSESLLEAEVRIIEEDSRHLARIIARASPIASIRKWEAEYR
jgi:hypothetical protein